MDAARLKRTLLDAGASVVGIAAVEEALHPDIAHLRRAVSIGVRRRLNTDTITVLEGLLKATERIMRAGGYRFLSIPADSDRITDTFVSRLYHLFSHKTAATCAGLGWIGRNGLLISPEYGPRVSFVTVLTSALLRADTPISHSLCGGCDLCVRHCPAGAITGRQWSRREPFPDLIRHELCRAHKKDSRIMDHKPNCGLCINICPHGRPGHSNHEASEGVRVEEGDREPEIAHK